MSTTSTTLPTLELVDGGMVDYDRDEMVVVNQQSSISVDGVDRLPRSTHAAPLTPAGVTC